MLAVWGRRGGSEPREGRPAPKPAPMAPPLGVGMIVASMSLRLKLGFVRRPARPDGTARARAAAMVDGEGSWLLRVARWKAAVAASKAGFAGCGAAARFAIAAIFAWREGGIGVEPWY